MNPGVPVVNPGVPVVVPLLNRSPPPELCQGGSGKPRMRFELCWQWDEPNRLRAKRLGLKVIRKGLGKAGGGRREAGGMLAGRG